MLFRKRSLSEMDCGKELTQEQYESAEYKVGYIDGVSKILGMMQRGHGKGHSLEMVISQVFEGHKEVYGDI